MNNVSSEGNAEQQPVSPPSREKSTPILYQYENVKAQPVIRDVIGLVPRFFHKLRVRQRVNTTELST